MTEKIAMPRRLTYEEFIALAALRPHDPNRPRRFVGRDHSVITDRVRKITDPDELEAARKLRDRVRAAHKRQP